MTRVLLYPEGKWSLLGAKRWEVTWEELRKNAKPNTEGDFDYDSDLVYMAAACSGYQEAKNIAEEKAKTSFFGVASIVEQEVRWFEESDNVAEWTAVGPAEEVTG